MNKQEFIKTLSAKLHGIPEDDRERSIEYYSEMIDDSKEDGLTEEQAVEAMGSTDEIAQRILNETVGEKSPKEDPPKRRKLSGAEIALIIIAFPVWFPILVSLFSVIISLYAVLWVLIMCIYVVALSFAVSGIASVPILIANISSDQLLGALFIFGCGLVLTGLCIPVFIGALKATSGCISITVKCFKKIKNVFSKRRSDVK